MAIVQTIDKQAFVNAFADYNRADQFSIEAREAIFDYIEEYSNDTGENIELDVIEVCCNWYEMTWEEVARDYSVDLTDCVDDDERIEAVEDFLNDSNYAIKLSDEQSFVFVCF